MVVFFDGLRPDYITEQNMPDLYAFSKLGCYGKQHHSVFPTVTRVNASSFSSGSYPGTHGLMGNTVYFPKVEKKNVLSTSNYNDLNLITEATHGHLLTAITLGEVLQQAGAKMMVFSSGSTGQAFMQNHTISGGALVNPELILPESFKEKLIAEIGVLRRCYAKCRTAPLGDRRTHQIWPCLRRTVGKHDLVLRSRWRCARPRNRFSYGYGIH